MRIRLCSAFEVVGVVWWAWFVYADIIVGRGFVHWWQVLCKSRFFLIMVIIDEWKIRFLYI